MYPFYIYIFPTKLTFFFKMHSDWMQLLLSATFSDHEYPARRGAGVDRNPWLAKLDNSLFDSIARLWYCRFTSKTVCQ